VLILLTYKTDVGAEKFVGASKYLSAGIPAVPCIVRGFEVFEVPKFLPTGAGPHVWSLVEKTGLTTPQLVQMVADQTGADQRDIGYAGLKDKHARTVQWLSSPKLFASTSRYRVIVAKPSRRKLRPGTLHGNWFIITLETNEPQKVIDVIKLIEPAVPNLFGPQRFGNRRNNHEIGRLLVNGRKRDAQRKMKHARIPLTRRFYRFMEDAYLSYLFNRIVNERIPDVKLHSYDIPSRYGPTAPLFGRKTMFAGGRQGEIERAVLEAEGITLSSFRWDGGRRPMFVPLKGLEYRATSNSIKLKFFLPKGSYATSVLREIAKTNFTSPSLSSFCGVA